MMKGLILSCSFLALADVSFADVNTSRTIEWSGISKGATDFAATPLIDFLGFRIGMSLDEALQHIGSDPRFAGGNFGFGEPIVNYDATLGRERVSVSFPLFDHVMKVNVTTKGAVEDALYLFFLPDPESRLIYGMNRRVSADDRTIGRKEFWEQTFKKFGTVTLDQINGYGRAGTANQANYSWTANNELKANKACIWGKPIFGGNGDVMFSIDPYSLKHLEGTANWLTQGCGTIITVGEGGMADTPALSSFSMLAFDTELYVKSLTINNAAKEEEIGKVEAELNDFKSNLGGSAPEL
ncbi:hypothetical protein HYN69_04765 [Gemmobacter aquarius]|uniref:Uncharacterized protein n=1 Tax=Paragemmobacter aquarius TaxID=2169400 RepID=A0A2S0UJF0_9RHOB|nr:hypothetical protein [Gemmobacter aquarius]AWB47915.1 hypothetical protein HYN69_04765 [Gemmobacter aquarius]